MKFFYSLALVLVALTTALSAYAQNQKSVVIGEMTSRPNALLVLNPPGNDQGFLLPQLTTTSRNAIRPSSPNEDGLLVFDITEKEFYYWKSNQWVKGLGGDESQSLSFDTETLELTLSDGNTIDLSLLKEIPTQQGNSGKFITTNGSRLSWASIDNIGDITRVSTGKGLSGGALSGDVTLAVKTDNTTIAFDANDALKLANTTVTPNTYGSGTTVPQFTVDAQGRITSASNVPITVGTGTGTPTLQSYSVDPSDFRGIRRNGGPADKVNAMIFEDNTTFVTVFKRDEASQIIAPIHLPDGATIQQVQLYYMDRDSRNLTLYVLRKTYTGTNENVVTPWTSSVNSASILTSTHNVIAGTDVVDNSQYSYRVIVDLEPTDDADQATEATHRVYGVQIKYVK